MGKEELHRRVLGRNRVFVLFSCVFLTKGEEYQFKRLVRHELEQKEKMDSVAFMCRNLRFRIQDKYVIQGRKSFWKGRKGF